VRVYVTRSVAASTNVSIYSLDVYYNTDLALNRSSSADSVGWSLGAENATDGNDGTRWSSEPNDIYPHWLKADLGGSYDFNQVKIHWEAAYAVDYKVQVSSDDTNWTDVAAVENNDSFLQTLNIAPVTARYVRIYVTRSIVASTNVSIYSLSVYNCPDLEFKKTATADSVGWSLGAENAVDGNDSTRWSSLPNVTYPHWLKVDLGEDYVFSHVKVHWEAAYAVDYKVQVSSDDVNWTDADTVSGNSSRLLTHSFTPVNARYVRIYVTLSVASASNVSIYSIDVY
jgi:hypothetical protein